MLNSFIRRFVFAAVLLVLFGTAAFSDDPTVSIYRDFDDGLFGRSLYRGVVFSVKLESFNRYVSLPVKDVDGLTAYLVSMDRAEYLAAGLGDGITVQDKKNRLFSYEKNGISISFSLEKAPEDLYEEIERTYSKNAADVIREVTESYRNGYVVRILKAENVYRPQFSSIDYEDILISAALIGNYFQPLWGIHDGNDITAVVN